MKQQYNTYLPKQLVERVREYCRRTGVTQSHFTASALLAKLRRENQKQEREQ